MKSNREFIDGIYEKANRLSQEGKQDENIKSVSRLFHTNIRSKIVLAAACTGTVLIAGTVLRWGQRKISGPMEEKSIVARTSSEDASPSVQVRGFKEVLPNIVEGNVKSIEEYSDNKMITIEVDERYTNEFGAEVEIIVSNEFYEKAVDYLKHKDIDKMVDQKVLLFVETYNLQEYYKISEEDQGVYFKYSDDHNKVMYENVEGIQSTRENLVEGHAQSVEP